MRSSVRRSAPAIARPVAVVLLAGLILLLAAAPAIAHTRLESSDPADGTSLEAAPQQVSLTFNETMTPEFTTVTVLGPDGSTHYETGEVTIDGGTVTATVEPLGDAGRYEIGYRVVSADGHPVTGSVAFTLTTPGPGATAGAPDASAAPAEPAAPDPPPAAAPSGDGGGAPVWPWIVGAVVLVGGGVVAALRLSKG